MDENLKNVGGESNLEVRQRMFQLIEELLNKYNGQKVVVVSHGAAIKFFLQHFCDYDFETNTFIFKNQTICFAKLESPSLFKLTFDGNNLQEIKKYNK